VRTDLGLSYWPQFAKSEQSRRSLCSELDLNHLSSAMPTERYVSTCPPVIPSKPLCIDQLSSFQLKALVSLAGGYRSSSSSRATLLEAVSNQLQSVNGKTWLVSNSKVCALTPLPTSLVLTTVLRASLPCSNFLLTVCLGVWCPLVAIFGCMGVSPGYIMTTLVLPMISLMKMRRT
jgi:hypothetical protein